MGNIVSMLTIWKPSLEAKAGQLDLLYYRALPTWARMCSGGDGLLGMVIRGVICIVLNMLSLERMVDL